MRLRRIDIAKGIAILAIVLGHLGIYDALGNEVLEPWVFAFHVPIFFVIAGYFESNKRPFKDFAIQKARRLLLPYVATSAFIILLVALLLLFKGDAWPSRFTDMQTLLLAVFYGTGSWFVHTFWQATPIGAIWFLPALFFASILQRLALKFKHGWLFNLLWAFLALISHKYFWLPFSLQSAALGALFMSFGHWLRKRDFLNFVNEYKRLSLLIFLVCLVIYILAGLFNLRISVSSLITATFPPLAIFIACVSSVFYLFLSIYLDKHASVPAKFFAFYGKNSLVVLCVHLVMQTFSFATMLSTFFGLSGNVLSIVNFAIQLAVFAACIVLFQRVKPLQWLFY